MFSFSAENLERIKKQNEKKISVIIGNPPYNANQMNENDNNKNREYKGVDKRIKETYIKHSTAQKTKVYDMYARFYRWAMDRVSDKGVIAFITNRSFIDSRTFDGFRKVVEQEFDFAYIVDTQSDVRKNPKIAGTSHNVFSIQTGVAILFLVKKEAKNHKCRIEYFTLTDEMRKREKLDWFMENSFSKIPFEHISPDKNHNWVNLTDNDFEDFLPLVNKEAKLSKNDSSEKAVFKLFSNGVVTARDEWVYDFDKKNLTEKVRFLLSAFLEEKEKWKKSDKNTSLEDFLTREIKFSDGLKQHLTRMAEFEETLEFLQSLPPNGKRKKIRALKEKLKPYKDLRFLRRKLVTANYRPFTKMYYYAETIFSDRLTQNHYAIFGDDLKKENLAFAFSGKASSKEFQILSIFDIWSLDLLEKTQCLPLYRYDKDGNRIENITDWGLQQFREHYANEPTTNTPITKEDIFHYTYGVLHNPAYRKKYELNLKREFPRLPFYRDFWKWAAWGKELMALHIGYESAEPFALQVEHKTLKGKAADYVPKAKLRRDKTTNEIALDEVTTLKGIPALAYAYKLGNRSAIEWILDQYKEKKPRDPTIREKFNTYRFADYKETVIDLIQRVTTVSVRTMEIVNQMAEEEGHEG